MNRYYRIITDNVLPNVKIPFLLEDGYYKYPIMFLDSSISLDDILNKDITKIDKIFDIECVINDCFRKRLLSEQLIGELRPIKTTNENINTKRLANLSDTVELLTTDLENVCVSFKDITLDTSMSIVPYIVLMAAFKPYGPKKNIFSNMLEDVNVNIRFNYRAIVKTVLINGTRTHVLADIITFDVDTSIS